MKLDPEARERIVAVLAAAEDRPTYGLKFWRVIELHYGSLGVAGVLAMFNDLRVAMRRLDELEAAQG
jgi:hypothetical protein